MATATLLLSCALPTVASASPPPAPGGRIITNHSPNPQAELLALASQIRKAYGEAGLVGSAVSQGALKLYWSGAVPSAALTVIAANPRISTQSIHVPWARSTLLAEARRISFLPFVTSAGVGADFKSIKVTVARGTSPSTIATISSELPLAVSEGRQVRFTSNRQNDDLKPHWGGAAISNAGDSDECSTGWGVYVNNSAATGIVTADHCGHSTWHPSGDSSISIGRSSIWNAGSDSQMITNADPSGGSYAGIIYTGAWDSGAGAYVKGWSDPSIGSPVCEGSALSGETCGAFVTEVDTFLGGIGPGYWSDWSDDQYATAGDGDSGSPSYTYRDSTSVELNGMTVAIDEAYIAPCRGPFQDRVCSADVFHTNVSAVLLSLNVTPLTGG